MKLEERICIEIRSLLTELSAIRATAKNTEIGEQYKCCRKEEELVGKFIKRITSEMRIGNIDLAKYKLAYFRGDSLSNSMVSQAEVMSLAEAGLLKEKPMLIIALIPKEAKLTDCWGDDWDDAPADCNASGLNKCPEGTIFLRGQLGEELKVE